MYERAASIIRPPRENRLPRVSGGAAGAQSRVRAMAERTKSSPWYLAAPTHAANLLTMCARPPSGPDRPRLGRWLVVAGLTLAASGCASRGPWQHSLDADNPLVGRIYQPAAGRFVDQATLVADLAGADFVLIGERHDNLDHHRLEALLVQALETKSEHPRAVAFEMIPSDRQLALVEYLQAHPGEAAGLGQAVGWAALGWPDWALYAPIAQAALEHGGTLVAADLSPAQSAAVFRAGPAILKAAMVRRTGLDQDLPTELAESLTDELRAAHCGQIAEPVVEGLFRVQRARDAMMADRLAAVAGRGGGVLIAGNGHVRADRGVPWYLDRRRPGARTVSVGLLEVWDGVENAPADLPFDYVWFTPRAGNDQPCIGAGEAPRSG